MFAGARAAFRVRETFEQEPEDGVDHPNREVDTKGKLQWVTHVLFTEARPAEINLGAVIMISLMVWGHHVHVIADASVLVSLGDSETGDRFALLDRLDS